MSIPIGSYIALPRRGAVTVSGQDRRAFLQGLITNDISLLDTQNMIYACLLTAQGKILHDFFVTEQDDTVTLECEDSSRAHDLAERISKFKLRSKVTIDVIETLPVYQAVDTLCPPRFFPDPRHPALGLRGYQKPDGMAEAPFDVWDRYRISLCIPDGSRDIEVGASTIQECHLDKLNAVSFEKGCYVGQELTARIHYRGLSKKHLYAVETTDGNPLPAPGSDLRVGDTLIGEMRSSCGDIGLVLLKDENVGILSKANLRQILTHPGVS